MLPRLDRISMQPSPDRCPADICHQTIFNGVSPQVLPAQSRQRQTESFRQFTRQRFNGHDDSGGKIGLAVRVLVHRLTRPAAFQKIVSAIYSRFAAACQTKKYGAVYFWASESSLRFSSPVKTISYGLFLGI
jgi:hypothetical protein